MNITEVKVVLNLLLDDLPDNPSKQNVLNNIAQNLMSIDFQNKVLSSLSCLSDDSIIGMDTWVIRSTRSPTDE